jgi:hypothetical protein
MIKSVAVTNHLGETVELELRFPEKSGFLIRGIEGLGPPKANINTTELSTSDGSSYNSARVMSRNIVFTLGFLGNPTIEDTRQLSYKYFPVKKRIKIVVETDKRVSEIYGYVESNEPSIFSKEESSVISVMCPNPYFYSTTSKVTTFSSLVPLFTFPFSNNSVTEKLMSFGKFMSLTSQDIYYTGDAETGIVINIHALGAVKNLSIFNVSTHELMLINTDKLLTLTGSGIIGGDDIIISTIKGAKSITLIRNGVFTNILNCLNRDVAWFQLSQGHNVFSYTADLGLPNMMFEIDNPIVYEGI